MIGRDQGLGIFVIMVVLALWEVLPTVGIIYPAAMPPLFIVLSAMAQPSVLWPILLNAVTTARNSLLGFLIGSFLGVMLGLVLGSIPRLYALSAWNIQMLRPIPAIGLTPVAILLFGLGDGDAVAISAYAVAWPILLNTIDGVRSVSPLFKDTGRVFKLNRLQQFRKIILPAASPFITTGLRIGIGLALLADVFVEMLNGTTGLGGLMGVYLGSSHLPAMYSAIIVVAILGLMFTFSFEWVEKRIMAWNIGWKARNR